MSTAVPLVLLGLGVFLSAVGLFLSLWIVVPAPTAALLPLSVGAPEVSPWLLLVNGLALLLSLAAKPHPLRLAALAAAGLALVLSALPVGQLPGVVRQANKAFIEQLGVDPTAQTPLVPETMLQPRPFSWQAAWAGIPATDAAIRQISAVPFAQPDGVPLTLEIYQPPAAFPQAPPYPTVVVVYGGAWQRGTPTQDAQLNRYLAAQGYVVIAVDYRHAPQYRFPAQLADVESAIAFICAHAAEYGANCDRMALLGRSAGAHLAMLAAYRAATSPLRGVVNYYGPVDLASAYRHPPVPDPIDTRSVLDAFLGGGPDRRPELYRQATPLEAVRPQLPPTLLFYGSRDHLVEAKYGRQLAQQLQAAGNAALFIEIPWADHAFDMVFNGVSSQLALYYTERFLAHVLRYSNR